jgi:hypothetical protein
MAHELYQMRAWLFDTMAADATLCNLIGGTTNPRIYQSWAAQGSAYPSVHIRFISSRDGKDLSRTRFVSIALFLVVAVGNNASYAALEPIASRIDTVLHKVQGTTLNGQRIWAERIQMRDAPEENDGEELRDSGAFYEVTVATQ